MLRQEELFTPLLTPQQGEGEKEFGNGEKEGEEAREELVVGGRQHSSKKCKTAWESVSAGQNRMQNLWWPYGVSKFVR